MPVKTSNSFHEKPEGFSPERRNVFKKLRRLLKQFPKGPATPSRASGTREKIVRSMSRNRAVVGAELCGRCGPIVRSMQAHRTTRLTGDPAGSAALQSTRISCTIFITGFSFIFGMTLKPAHGIGTGCHNLIALSAGIVISFLHQS